MANYTAYIPTVGSTNYPTQLSNFITLSEAIDTEVENARDGQANLLTNINLKLPLAGGILTGALIVSTGNLTLSAGNLTLSAGNIVVSAGTLSTSGNILVGGTVDGRDVATDGTKLDGIEDLADVTDTINVTAAGALMDSEIDVNIKTLILPASTTISTFGASIVDDVNANAVLTTLGLDTDLATISIPASTTISTFGASIVDDTNADAVRTTIGAAASGANTDITSLASSTTATTQVAGDSSTKLATTAFVNIAASVLSSNYLYGLEISNNGTDANNDIDIAVGGVRDSGNTTDLILTSAFTKKLDVTWAVGTAAGGLFSGSKAADETYHIFLIEKDSDNSIDIGFDTSTTAANKPAGYTNYRRIGSIVTNGSSNIYQFTQVGNYFNWNLMESDFSASFHTSRATRTLRVPTDIVVIANIGAAVTNTSINVRIWFGALNVTDFAPSTTTCTLSVGSANSADANSIHIETNTSGQIATRCSTTGGTLGCHTIGYIDNRGQ